MKWQVKTNNKEFVDYLLNRAKKEA